MLCKDLLKRMLMASQARRISMAQVLEHKYCVMDQAPYTKGYEIAKAKGYEPAVEPILAQEVAAAPTKAAAAPMFEPEAHPQSMAQPLVRPMVQEQQRPMQT